MYRLMLYYLTFLVAYSAVLSGIDVLISAFYLVAICWASNKLLAKVFKVSSNPQSSLITGLILSLITGPGSLAAGIAGIAAMASKYLFAWKGRHIFNPAAFGAVFTALALNHGASWWIGSFQSFPLVVIGALLILKKIKRFELVGVFLLATLILSFSTQFQMLFLESPIIFFASVMLIEPLTSPFSRKNQIIYAILVALTFYLFGRLFISIPLELALLAGNIFSFIANGSFRQVLRLKEKKQESKDVISFLFEPPSAGRGIKFEPGQYLEWTLTHKNPDSRGVRRFFTISSSPTENFIMLSTKFSDKSSSFKKALKDMRPGDEITVSNLEGDFTLPKDAGKKLVFLAGGIGITPFRCMAKYLIDTNQKRDIVLLYSVKNSSEIVYKDVFEAGKNLGLKPVYVTTDTTGFINQEMISKEVPDFKERYFYISGPHSMVDSFGKTLKEMGVSSSQIKTDFFPGYA